MFPTIAGFVFTFYQCYIWYTNGPKSAFDNSLNGIFGIFVAIGSTAAIQSWKQKSDIIRYYWGLDKEVIQSNNERTQEFNFNYIYNKVTGRKEKKSIEIDWKKIKINYMFGVLAFLSSFGVVALYFLL